MNQQYNVNNWRSDALGAPQLTVPRIKAYPICRVRGRVGGKLFWCTRSPGHTLRHMNYYLSDRLVNAVWTDAG